MTHKMIMICQALGATLCIGLNPCNPFDPQNRFLLLKIAEDRHKKIPQGRILSQQVSQGSRAFMQSEGSHGALPWKGQMMGKRWSEALATDSLAFE
jgi:hypothetical protein